MNWFSPIRMASIKAASAGGHSVRIFSLRLRCERVRHSSIRFPAKPGSNSTLAALVEPQNGDSLLCEIALIIECAGIAEVSRRAKFGRKSEPLPVVKNVHWARGSIVFIIWFRLFCINPKAHSRFHWDCFGFRSDLFGFHIDRLSQSAEARLGNVAFGNSVRRD